jgi:hypothetical protein
MSYRNKTIMTWTTKFDTNLAAITNVYFGVPADNTNFLDWDQYVVGDVPAAGSTLSPAGAGTSSLLKWESPANMAQFVAPINCRLVAISYALDMSNPSSGCTHIRFAAMSDSDFSDEDSRTENATWTSLGYVDSTAMTGDPAGQVQKGSAQFSSSNGDVNAGDCVGAVLEAFGAGAGAVSGIITMTFEGS